MHLSIYISGDKILWINNNIPKKTKKKPQIIWAADIKGTCCQVIAGDHQLLIYWKLKTGAVSLRESNSLNIFRRKLKTCLTSNNLLDKGLKRALTLHLLLLPF